MIQCMEWDTDIQNSVTGLTWTSCVAESPFPLFSSSLLALYFPALVASVSLLVLSSAHHSELENLESD